MNNSLTVTVMLFVFAISFVTIESTVEVKKNPGSTVVASSIPVKTTS